MNLTTVTGVSSHLEVAKMVQSIDEPVEIILVLNRPTDDARKLVTQLASSDKRIRVFEIAKNSLGMIKNIGIKNASHDNILFIDADCQLRKGALRKFYDGLQYSKICKGVVKITPSTYLGAVVALARDSCNPPTAYTPGLAIRKDIVNDLGFFFHDDLYWREDYEFHCRIKKKGIPITFIAEAIMDHPETFLYHDLRTAYRCGTGHRIGVAKNFIANDLAYGGGKSLLASAVYDIKRLISLPGEFMLWYKFHKRLDVCIYKLFWRAAFTTGYYAQALFDVQGVTK